MAAESWGAIPADFGPLQRLRRRAKFAAIERWAGRGRDATDLLISRPSLVVAPHPDDETLGCGLSIIGKRAQNLDVWVIFVSDGGASHPPGVIDRAELVARRRAEGLAATAALGVPEDHVTFLDLPDGGVAEHIDYLTDRLTEIMKETGAPEMLIPSALDHNPDHVACNDASLRARARCSWEPHVYEYTIWFWYHFPRLDPAWSPSSPASWVRSARLLHRLRPLVVSLAEHRTQKAGAMEVYESQFLPFADASDDRVLPSDVFARFDNGRELFFERE